MIVPFPDKKFNIIYADPPWQQVPVGFKTKRKSPLPYQSMSTRSIRDLPVQDISEDNAALFLWVTNRALPDGLEVIKSWGFNFKTIVFVWLKSQTNSYSLFSGLGYYTKANAEICLLATRGSIPPKERTLQQVHRARIEKHSKKPHLFREQIVRLFGDLPRIELFSREKIIGWDAWGNQIPQLEPLDVFIK